MADTENPANDPTRTWSPESDPTHVELYLLTLQSRAASTLELFCRSVGAELSPDEAAAWLRSDPEAVIEDIVRTDKYSDAFGHVPVYTEKGGRYSVAPEAATAFLRALGALRKDGQI
ncbi:hypothetical protein [Nocardiopsis nanhaiensis]